MTALSSSVHIYARPHTREALIACFTTILGCKAVASSDAPHLPAPVIAFVFSNGAALSVEFTEDALDEQHARWGRVAGGHNRRSLGSAAESAGCRLASVETSRQRLLLLPGARRAGDPQRPNKTALSAPSFPRTAAFQAARPAKYGGWRYRQGLCLYRRPWRPIAARRRPLFSRRCSARGHLPAPP